MATVTDRFWSKVEKTESCWLWRGSLTKGYGHFRPSSKKLMYTHRYSWLIHFGDIPNGLLVLHKCDIPACVNPAHLWLGTDMDNFKDCKAKGRRPVIRVKVCKHGHEFTAENTYQSVVKGKIKRQCRECRRRIDRERSPRH